MPTSALRLWPQQRTPPAVVTTQVCLSPAAIAWTSAMTSAAGGVARSVLLPSPSWPMTFPPQQRTPPAGHERAGVPAAGGDRLHARQHVAGRGGRPLGHRAVAQLAAVVRAPAANAAAGHERAGVRVAGRDRLDAGEHVGGGRRGARRRRAVAELAVAVPAPAADAAGRRERAGVERARGQRVDAGQDVDRGRRRSMGPAPPPSSPRSFAPQQRTPPVLMSAQVWLAPTAICSTAQGARLLRASM